MDLLHLSSEYRHLLTWPLTDGMGSNGRNFWCEVINFRWSTAHQYNHEDEGEEEEGEEEEEEEEGEEEEEEGALFKI